MMRANKEAYTVKYDSSNHCEVLFKRYGSVWPRVSDRERQWRRPFDCPPLDEGPRDRESFMLDLFLEA